MKKLLIAVYVFAITLLPSQVFAQYSGELIRSFVVDAELSSNQRLTVTEAITYDFGTNSRHGIFRSIPVLYDRDGGSYQLSLSIDSVKMDGKDAPFTKSISEGILKIRIGDADVYVTGTHVYTITYSTERALNTFDQEKELYWNVTGNGWQVPILESRFTLKSPSVTQQKCYTGVLGSIEEECLFSQTVGGLSVKSKGVLESYEGLTAVVRFPSASFTAFPLWKQVGFLVRDYAWAFIPGFALVVLLCIWYLKGRDPKGRSAIIAEYDEPSDVSFLSMMALVDQTISTKAITGYLLDLARRGFMTIEYSGSKQQIMTLVKAATTPKNATEEEKHLIERIFGSKTELVIGSYIKDFHQAIEKVRSDTMSSLTKQGYFGARPGYVRALWYVLAILVTVFLIFFIADYVGALMVPGALLTGIFTALVGHHMPRVTTKGALIRDHVLGFKRFLSVTEKERLAFTDAPKMKPEQFARYLPAAVALGVENEWAKQFASMMVPPPSYTHGLSQGLASNYTKSMSTMSSKISNSFTPPSSSAGSGGSGFSGGGSGGGFGGGGGGSW